MGCAQSSESGNRYSSCCKEGPTAASLPTGPVNEVEVDCTHFSSPKEILGIGGFGIVRRVIKLTGHDTQRSFAMKSMSKATILSRPSGTAAVLTELKALILVQDSEFICKIHYAFQDEFYLYLILDFAEGGDMRYNLRKAPLFRFSENLSRALIFQVFMALDHCHRCFILHRDGSVKLTDFGVAKILPDIERCKSTSGTHGYMAPEIYTGDHIHGTPFDWFCTGITLHEFLTGRRPWEAVKLQRYCSHTPQATLELDVLDRLSLSRDCISFVTDILHPYPKKRLGTEHGIQSILSHPWMRGVHTSKQAIVEMLKAEVPLFHQLHDKRGSRPINRINMTKDDAMEYVKQHQQAHVIAKEIQAVFRDFEYNNKFTPLPKLQNESNKAKPSLPIVAASSPVTEDKKRNSGRVSFEDLNTVPSLELKVHSFKSIPIDSENAVANHHHDTTNRGSAMDIFSQPREESMTFVGGTTTAPAKTASQASHMRGGSSSAKVLGSVKVREKSSAYFIEDHV